MPFRILSQCDFVEDSQALPRGKRRACVSTSGFHAEFSIFPLEIVLEESQDFKSAVAKKPQKPYFRHAAYR